MSGDGESSDEGQASAEVERATHTAKEAAEGLGKNIGGLIDDSDPDDHTREDVEAAFETGGEIAGAAEEGAEAWGETEDAVKAAQSGDTAGVVDGIGGAASGTAGHVADNLSAIGHLTHDEGFADAARVARVAQTGIETARRVADQVFDAVERVEDAAHERSRHVEYELTIEDAEGWKLDSLAATEALNEPYELVLEIHHEDEDADARALLGHNVELLVDRRDHNRRHCGVVRRVVEGGHRRHRASAQLFVVPALWSLSQGRGSRIFQDRTAPQILEEVLTEGLRPFRREVDVSGLEGDYPPREFCVQYRESPLDFCHRLMEEEGIGYRFDFDGEGWERLVLFERNGQLEDAPTLDGGPVPFVERAEVIRRAEPIVDLRPAGQLTETRVTVCDYDWTQGTTRLESTTGGEDEQGRARASYEHGLGRSATRHGYDEGTGRFADNDVARQAQIRGELQVRDAHTLRGVSLVTGFAPGRTFEVSGHPTVGVDGRYVITRVEHRSGPPPEPGEQAGARGGAEDYHNTFECIPVDVPWRPARRTPAPSIGGVQTAVVTGGNPGEIITDRYGRVRVQFQWDPEPDAQRTSCWIRTAQIWGGHDAAGHPGFLFIPRVGMEVVVTFLDGNPDRPLVTNTVYNANNLPPVGLPDEASRSVIRTRSLGGEGFNELSFEDAAGGEEVYLHAQRNLREKVLHNHDTHVGADQTNKVDGDQEERVKGGQKLTVERDREHIVEGNETNRIDHVRRTEVVQDDWLTVRDGGRHVTIGDGDELRVTNARTVDIGGHETRTVGEGMTTTVQDGGVTETITGGVSQTIATEGMERVIESGGLRTTTVGGVSHQSLGDTTETATGAFTIEGDRIVLRAGTKVVIDAPQGIDKVGTGSNVEQRSSWDIAADNVCEMISAMKASFVGLSISDAAIKISQTGVSFGQTSVKIDDTRTKVDMNQVGIKKALLTIIG